MANYSKELYLSNSIKEVSLEFKENQTCCHLIDIKVIEGNPERIELNLNVWFSRKETYLGYITNIKPEEKIDFLENYTNDKNEIRLKYLSFSANENESFLIKVFYRLL